jgi:NAD(P)-dependent dehydrogenase (short-subunit alcohol dehydrogenase family)
MSERRKKTVDGFETTFAVNHLGHFLLANLLLPDFVEDSRITFVSSGAHDPAEKSGMPEPRYETAKVTPQNKCFNSALRGHVA